VEFVLVLPPLLLCLLGILQFGIAFGDWIQVTNAARDGARKATVSRYDAAGVTTVQNYAKKGTWSLNKSAMAVSVSPGQPWTAGQNVTVTVTYPFSINVLGVVVKSGKLSSTQTARIE
jgi:Flp pilus assembly protein TadG